MSGQFVMLECRKCHKTRKFMIGTEREKQRICGECWDWAADS